MDVPIDADGLMLLQSWRQSSRRTPMSRPGCSFSRRCACIFVYMEARADGGRGGQRNRARERDDQTAGQETDGGATIECAFSIQRSLLARALTLIPQGKVFMWVGPENGAMAYPIVSPPLCRSERVVTDPAEGARGRRGGRAHAARVVRWCGAARGAFRAPNEDLVKVLKKGDLYLHLATCARIDRKSVV